MFTHYSLPPSLSPSLQLEAKCFSQQETLDSLQEQLESEREQAEAKRAALEKELALRVDQVHVCHQTQHSSDVC